MKLANPVEPVVSHYPEPRLELVRRARGDFELELGGRLPSAWLLGLARGCADAGAGLVRGRARLDPRSAFGPGSCQGREAQWLGRFEIEAQSDIDEERLLAWATGRRTMPRPPEPAILDFELAESPSFGGCLELEVHAWDAVGLLAAVLGRAGDARLHPVSIALDTEEECAFHRLALRGEEPGVPSWRRCRALLRGLRSLLRAG